MKFSFLVITALCFIASTCFAEKFNGYLFKDYKETPIYLLADLSMEQFQTVRDGLLKDAISDGFKPYMIGSDEIVKITAPNQKKTDHYYFIRYTFKDDIMQSEVTCYRKVTIEHNGKKYQEFMPVSAPTIIRKSFLAGQASIGDAAYIIGSNLNSVLDKVKETNAK